METTEMIILCAIAYITVGIALVGYDYSAPPLHKKPYAISKNMKFAVAIWFIWPLYALREAYVEHKLGRSAIKFILGISVLAIAIFFWGKLAFSVSDKLIGITWVNAVITLVFLLLSSPIITRFAMPRHGR